MRHLRPLLILAAGLTGAFAADSLRSRAHDAWSSGQRYEDTYYLPPPAWLPALSLGYREAAADFLWMRALIYFGDELVQRGESRYVFEYADAIVTLDPEFLAVYRWVGMAGFYGAQATTPTEAERAVAFMERGAERFPDDGRLAWEIGAALAFEVPMLLDDPAARDEARQRAAPHLMRAVRLGAAPEWVTLSGAAMLSRIGETHQAVRHLEEMYPLVRDPSVRAEIAERIEQLRTRAREEGFERSLRELDEATRGDPQR